MYFVFIPAPPPPLIAFNPGIPSLKVFLHFPYIEMNDLVQLGSRFNPKPKSRNNNLVTSHPLPTRKLNV